MHVQASAPSKPTPVAPVVKKKHSRTRNGCITCRIRKVKCDEVRPACRKCLDTGRKCDGYSKPAPASLEVPVPQGNLTSYSHCELFAYQYFQEVSAPSLVNFGSHYFWNKLVIQVALEDEAIRHLVLATALLDCRERGVLGLDKANKYHDEHYRTALRTLGTRANPDPAILLMACLLFIVCEEFNQNRFGALQHIIAGRRIMSGYSHKDRVQCSDAIEELAPIFRRLEIQTGEFEQEILPKQLRWPFKDNSATWAKKAGMDPSWSRPKSSIFQGYASLAMASYCLRCLVPACQNPLTLGKPPLTRFQIVPNITAKLNQWLVYFDEMVFRYGPKEAAANRVEVHLLRVHYMCLYAMSRCDPYLREELYDLYFSQFEHVMIKMSHLITEETTDAVKERCLCPLFFVATHYRATAFRRMAIEYLRKCDWPGRRMAMVAEQMMKIEERAVPEVINCADVPPEARIRLIDISFPEAKSGDDTEGALCMLTYSKAPHDGKNNDVQLFRWKDMPKDRSLQESVKQLLRRVMRYEILSIGDDKAESCETDHPRWTADWH
ncbi:uncharacterized protein HMPREF1541_03268 [Cyphellophora europaea CBS 101466]|uniref:Zn(2)-C6 fungal-type domain-containing protein n=1 Tax=Cyphellophora europaea (strain CBS 101466) TaxID=1220924 RepID=W2RZW0_CYPE1|nr:uncharacterized protein HMPREF1541_03268 [Cyphellophora europaea CBS 101466]ETN41333.1 hypothetical protein HMPREF1541_03268 [Cyphellophora europaea CBS 101466]